MAGRQGNVVVRIFGEIRDLVGKLREGSNEVGRFATSSRNVIQKSFSDLTSIVTSRFGRIGAEAQKVFDRIGSRAASTGNAVGLGVGAGAAVAAAGLVDLGVKGVKAFVDLASQVRTFSRLSGESAETSSRWVGVTHALGIEQDALARGLAMLNRRVNEHSDLFEKDSVVIARNSNGSVNLFETLLNVSDAYKRVGGGAAGLTIAQDTLGARMATNLLPVLAAGRDRVEEFWDAAEQHGEILNDDDLKKARDFQVALREMSQAVKGLEMSLGEGLIPVFTDVAEASTTVVDVLNKVTKPLGGIAGAVDKVEKVALGGLGLPVFGHHAKKAGDDAEDAAAMVDDLSDSLDSSVSSMDAAADAADTYSKALSRLRDDMFGLSDAQDAVNADFEDLTQQADDLADRRAKAAKRVADAEESAARRIRDAEEGVADAKDELNKLNTQEGRDDARKRLRDAEERLSDARREGAESIQDAKDSLGEVERKHQDINDQIRQQREQLEKIPDDVAKVVAEMEKQKKPPQEILGYIESQVTRLREQTGVLSANKMILQQIIELLKQYEAFVGFTAPTKGKTYGGFGIDFATNPFEQGPSMAEVQVTQNFYGQTDPDLAGRAVSRAVRDVRRRG